ncbi:MAG: carbohydrate kinase family protein [Cyclobacteriaceae bacterium]|nr:carbohydrate kinase family protein [Cyclobacteriaceae bacterium]
MKKYDVLVIGELNVDLILNNIRGFPEIGKEITAGDMQLTLGSSSAIFACNLSIIGATTAFLGLVGNDDFGNQVVNTLGQKQVSTEYIIRHSEHKTGATIALNYGEERAMVTYPGAMEHLTLREITMDVLQQCRHLHVSSVFLQPGILNHLPDIFLRAKNLGLTTSLDTQWDPVERWNLNLKKILPLVDVFLPNDQEIMALTKTGNVHSAIESIKDPASIIAVKMGKEGSLGYQAGKKIMAEPYPNPDFIDAIGAGDSFNAGFILKFLQDADIEQCLRFGNLMGAINTTAPGGTTAFISFEEVKKVASEKFNFEIDL